jgi:hypothetical protein
MTLEAPNPRAAIEPIGLRMGEMTGTRQQIFELCPSGHGSRSDKLVG